MSPVFSAADLYQGTADTGKDLSVSYTYNDRDLLSSIVTPTTTYGFEYGNFGLRTKVTIGGNTLVSYAYNARNQLTQQTYGNEDFVQFEYDDIGRVTKQTYEDGATVTYAYDNIGNLATVTDSATGIVTTYYYDLLNRQVGYWEKSETLDHRVVYAYNEDNNVSSITETVNGTTKTYSYTYDDDNRLISENADGITVTYTYDDLGRLTQKQTKNGENPILTHSYYFNTTSDGKTSMQIWGNTIDTPLGGYQVSYYYDDNGNITHAFDQETVDANYVYDSQGQLIRENNWLLDFTYVWTYDNAGNILSRTEYDYTSGSLDGITPTDTVVYGYTDDTWGDLLTSYDGNTITYDNIGNPTNDGTWSYTWQHGRELASMSNGTTTWTYTYDANGMRTGKSDGYLDFTYVYSGSKLVSMVALGLQFDFTYDANGTPLTITENGITYYYITNLQGDVIGILDSNGTQVVTYTYDAWGNVQIDSISQISDFNPLLYRGYVYDHETELYYLQSRYYNPEWGRFINADDVAYLGADGTPLSYNLFAYCKNNPLLLSDDAGTFGILSGIAIAGIVISAIVGAVAAGANTANAGGSAGEIFASCVIGAVVGGGIATVAALGGIGILSGGAVAFISAGIGAAGEVASISVEHAVHKNDAGYKFSWGKSVIRVAYAATMGAASGGLSYGINTIFTGPNEFAGMMVAAETSVGLGAVDFGIRQLISIETTTTTSSALSNSSYNSAIPLWAGHKYTCCAY